MAASLPPELLIHIFLDLFPPPNTPPSLTTALLLSHVCSSWRAIVLGLPAFWTNIVVRSNFTDLSQFIHLWAIRAHPRPLTISLATENTGIAINILGAAIAYHERWQDVDMDLPSPRDLFPSLVDAMSGKSMPLLRRLVLKNVPRRQHDLQSRKLIDLSNAPNLEELCLVGVSPTQFTGISQRLRALRLDDIPRFPIDVFLHSLPQLVELTLPSAETILDDLILAFPELPNIHEVYCADSGLTLTESSEDEGSGTFSALLSGSGSASAVRTMSIYNIGCIHLPHLERLSVEGIVVADKFVLPRLRHLRFRMVSTHWDLPRLHELTHIVRVQWACELESLHLALTRPALVLRSLTPAIPLLTRARRCASNSRDPTLGIRWEPWLLRLSTC
uniref:F-box domain-containing protein n=1 Tax=Mycena chlorophos TaxID=658473 RepID=A0ABQ0L6E9_MYCCL|nr:predicted protein [Mycena chlorophos]